MSDLSQETTQQFCDRKMREGMVKLEEWIKLNPDATAEEGAQVLFEILMGGIH